MLHISPQGLPRPRCRGALGALPLLVLPVLNLLNFSRRAGACHLPADGPQALADSFRDRLHVVRPEVSRQGGEDGLTGSGGVGIGHRDTFRPLPVEDVEDVVVVGGDDTNDGQGGFIIRIRTLGAFPDCSGIHHPQGGEDHRDAEEAPGEAVGAGGVAVSVELLHPFFLAGEEVVEFLRLRERERKPDLRRVLQPFVEGLLSQRIEGFFQGAVAAVGGEAVQPLWRGVDAEEHEAREQAVFGIPDEGFDLFRRA